MEHRFRIKQGGQVVAQGYGNKQRLGSEAAHYLAVYGQDGPVQIEWQVRTGVGDR